MKKSLVKQLGVVSIALSVVLLTATSAQAVTRSCNFTVNGSLIIAGKSFGYNKSGSGSGSAATVLHARIAARNNIQNAQRDTWYAYARSKGSPKGSVTLRTSGDKGCELTHLSGTVAWPWSR
jgi:hypothetical protein